MSKWSVTSSTLLGFLVELLSYLGTDIKRPVTSSSNNFKLTKVYKEHLKLDVAPPPPTWRKSSRPWYPLKRRLGGPQTRFGRCGEEKYLLSLTVIETQLSGCSDYSLLTIPTEPSLFILTVPQFTLQALRKASCPGSCPKWNKKSSKWSAAGKFSQVCRCFNRDDHQFYVYGSVHRWSILIIVQRDVTQSSLFIILQVHPTCFGCQPHPSSGVHKTVTTAFGTGHIFAQLPPPNVTKLASGVHKTVTTASGTGYTFVQLPASNVAKLTWSEVAAQKYDQYRRL